MNDNRKLTESLKKELEILKKYVAELERGYVDKTGIHTDESLNYERYRSIALISQAQCLKRALDEIRKENIEIRKKELSILENRVKELEERETRFDRLYQEVQQKIEKRECKRQEENAQNVAVILDNYDRREFNTEKEAIEVLKIYRKFAEQGNAKAQCGLGHCYYYGNGVEYDYKEALKWYMKSAKKGNAIAKHCLGKVCWMISNTQEDSFMIEKRECKEQEENAQNVAVILDNYDRIEFNTEKEAIEALKIYKKFAEQGNAKAQCGLGHSYYLGNGVEQDYNEAVKWYMKSAEQRNAVAQESLGECYYFGDGVEKNCEEAVKWFRKSAEQGNANAQNFMGLCYSYGDGVDQNYEKAIKWCKKAAGKGHVVAQYNLGVFYGEGKNYDEAVRWYKKAAEQGDVDSQRELGYCYDEGLGVNQNYEESIRWYKKAAEQEDSYAKERLKELG